jgi:hypothetical protein
MSVSSSPLQPTSFAAFLQSPEGIEAIKNAYTPPSAVTDTIAHNRAIIQDVFRLTSPTYVLPAHLFTTVADQQLWKDALIQSHGPGMPPAKNRAPLSSISAWIQPVPVLATSTALDWAHSDSDSWFLKFPASLRPRPQTDAYATRPSAWTCRHRLLRFLLFLC